MIRILFRKRKHFLQRKETKILLIVLGLAAIIYAFRKINDETEAILQRAPKWLDSEIWAEDHKPHINPHKYKYVQNEPDYCGSDRVDLLILVSSALSHDEHRSSIRKSWAAKKRIESKNVKVLFLLGSSAKSAEMRRIADESRVFADIIQEDFNDSYRNLTLKTVMGLKWASVFCPQARHVMKTDDDIFVNVPEFHRALQVEPSSFNGITGCIKNGPQSAPQPIPDPNNAVLFDPAKLPPAHPDFVAGAGYIMPGGDFAASLYLSTLETRPFPVEDVFTTAHAARRCGKHPPTHDARFSCGQMAPESDCEVARGGSFTTHKVVPERMIRIIESVESGKCSQKSAL